MGNEYWLFVSCGKRILWLGALSPCTGVKRVCFAVFFTLRDVEKSSVDAVRGAVLALVSVALRISLRAGRVVVGRSSPGFGSSGRTYGRFESKWGRTWKVGSKDMDFNAYLVQQLGYLDFLGE
ncbi:hypothetical protein L1887_32133 [Cichorium endivia]|nr:hypothetical protein L1887_32133 [Cichorium endivia]